MSTPACCVVKSYGSTSFAWIQQDNKEVRCSECQTELNDRSATHSTHTKMRKVARLFIPFILAWIQPWLSISSVESKISTAAIRKLHRLYINYPAHDTTMYDILEVTPNATESEIAKSYRRLCRRYHPDKVSKLEYHDLLQQVRRAYEILKDDRSRVLYHRFGIVDMMETVLLLTGRTTTIHDPLLQELLLLMGHPLDGSLDSPQLNGAGAKTPTQCTQNFPRDEHEERVRFLAFQIAKQIQPFLRGEMSETELAASITLQCHRLKGLPMGAQILRCIGRAYLHAGQRTLRRCREESHRPISVRYHDEGRPKSYHDTSSLWKNMAVVVNDSARARWRDTKGLADAAAALVHCSVHEIKHLLVDKEIARARYSSFIKLGDGFGMGTRDYRHRNRQKIAAPSENDVRTERDRHAIQASRDLLRIEALWKVKKVKLDRTVRQACNLLLESNHVPTLSSYSLPVVRRGSHMPFLIARLLVLVGEVMLSHTRIQRVRTLKDSL